MIETKTEGNVIITCVFCNEDFPLLPEAWISGMMDEGCDSCGYGASVDVTIEIKCPHCGRVVYKKEGTVY